MSHPRLNIFCFGSGAVLDCVGVAATVIAVEDDPRLFVEATSRLDLSVGRVELIPEADDYVRFPTQLGEKFDVIVIGGSHRYRCAVEGTHSLVNDGLLVVLEPNRYPAVVDALRDTGWTRQGDIGTGFRRQDRHALVFRSAWGTAVPSSSDA